jgi:hypothetical protein
MVLQFYHISYESIKEGIKEWILHNELDKDIPIFELIPLNSNRFLAFPSGNDGVMGYDWVTFGFDGNKLFKIDQGYWLDSESGGYYFDRAKNRRVSKHEKLADSWNSSIVHTKNYLTIFNHYTGRMLVFSKETGKLKRRAKLTPAVPPEQDNECVCVIPVITLQPDLDDSIVVLAHKDIDILKSMDMVEAYNNLFKEGKLIKGDQFLGNSMPNKKIVILGSMDIEAYNNLLKEEEGIRGNLFLENSKPIEEIVILRSMDMPEAYNNLLKEGEVIRGNIFLKNSKPNHNGVQWYRVNLESGIIEKRNRGDVPDTYDDMRFPFFIPFGYDNILWGGDEKGFPELIGSVFKKPTKESEENAAESEVK